MAGLQQMEGHLARSASAVAAHTVSGHAFNQHVAGTATVSAGSLTESTVAAPSVSVTLNGTDQTPTYTLPITATDAGLAAPPKGKIGTT